MMRRANEMKRAIAVGAAMLVFAVAFAAFSQDLFAATHTSLAESGSSTT